MSIRNIPDNNLLQFSADNADHNTITIDGLSTLNSIGVMAIFTPILSTHSMAWAWWRFSLLLLLHTCHGMSMMAIITPASTSHIPWHEHDGDFHSCFYFTHSMAWAWWRLSLLLLLHTFHGMSMMAIITPASTSHIPWHEHDGDYHSCFYFTHSMAWAWWRLSLLLLLHTFHGMSMMAIITPAFTSHIPLHKHDGNFHSCFYSTHSMAWAWWRLSLLLLLHTFHGMSMMAIITPASTSHIPWHEHDGDYHSCFYFTHSMAWTWWRFSLLLLLHTFHGMSMMAIIIPASTSHIPWHEHDGDYHSCFYFTHSMAWAWWRLSLLLLLQTFHGINMMAIFTPAFTPHIPWHEHDGDFHSCFYFTHSMAWAWWRLSLLLLLHTFHGMSMMAIITPAFTSHIPWHKHDGDFHSCFYSTHSMAWAWWRLSLLLLLHTFHGMSMMAIITPASTSHIPWHEHDGDYHSCFYFTHSMA